MKRVVGIMLLCAVLSGCSENKQQLDRVMSLRAKLLATTQCCFEAVVTADYGDEILTFRMDCRADGKGGMIFTVKEPEAIAGITGSMSHDGGKLTFDNQAVAFSLLADGQVTPVSAPWLLIKTLRGGYIQSCGTDGEYLRVAIDDSYEDDALHLDIWLDDNNAPVWVEIVWDGQRIVSLEVSNFEIM